jgi:hypothetical protein
VDHFGIVLIEGVEFQQPPHDEPWERSATAFDPDGYAAEFAQGKRGQKKEERAMWWFIARDEEAPNMPNEEEGDRPSLYIDAEEEDLVALGAVLESPFTPSPVFAIEHQGVRDRASPRVVRASAQSHGRRDCSRNEVVSRWTRSTIDRRDARRDARVRNRSD